MPARTTHTPQRDPWSGTEYKQFRKDVSDIAEAAREFAALSRFARKWTGWAIAAIGILYPTASKIIAQLPPFPH